MTVDTKSYELAEHFSQDYRITPPEQIQKLAEAIQLAVEEKIAELGWVER